MRSVLYWLAVLVMSLALVIGLILLLESRDGGSIESGGSRAPEAQTARANTTIRWAALYSGWQAVSTSRS